MSDCVFLSAHWKNLVVLNFEVQPDLLAPYVPLGTELDFHNGKTYVSLVAFEFLKNKFLGMIPTVPAYNFEEINLRFYIRRQVNGEWRRAVAFIREIVPSRAIALTARFCYNEPYVALKTTYKEELSPRTLTYTWFDKATPHRIRVETQDPLFSLPKNSHEEFILEHYWGYTAQEDGSTVEYQVKHPPWRYWKTHLLEVSPEIADFYGAPFSDILKNRPVSTFVAEGSDITVSVPRRFRGKVTVQNTPASNVKGWVLYDGLCGFCSWWIPFWRKTIQKTGYDIAALQEPWVKSTLNLPQHTLNADIRLLLNDGTLINGADAYIFGMKTVWWSRPVGMLLGLPLLRQATWVFYRWFNRSRFAVSRVCGLKPKF